LAGCQAMAPFEVIVLAAGLPDMPRELLRQLSVGGVMVVPLGWPDQRLVVVRRGLDDETGAPVFERFEFDAVQFVPILKGVQR
ncbi:MAG: protein-L-isoaspartate O-methyltransferase, partial [Burkholderiaceae bacterium]